MKCKNCNIDLQSEDNYCYSCGAKVINERITIKHLFSDLVASLGWDNQFWSTCRDLVLKPGLVFDRYLNGTRKKYSSPFTYFAIVTTISVLIIGFYSNEMIELTSNINFVQTETAPNSMTDQTKEENIGQQDNNDYSPNSQIFMREMATFMFKYYYYYSFLCLPFFTLIAFFVFGKPNNFAEHLVINSYILGFASILGLLLFAVNIITKTTELFYWGEYAIILIYYPYAYQNYRHYSFKKILLKILRFFIVVFVITLVFAIVIFLAVIAAKFLKN